MSNFERGVPSSVYAVIVLRLFTFGLEVMKAKLTHTLVTLSAPSEYRSHLPIGELSSNVLMCRLMSIRAAQPVESISVQLATSQVDVIRRPLANLAECVDHG